MTGQNAPELQRFWSDRRVGSGILLVGHGTRSAIGTGQFLALAEQVARQVSPAALEPAFLELQQPAIREAIGRLLTRGMERLIGMPMLLFAAGHAKRDIPQGVQEALAECGRGDLPWVQAGHLGCHPSVLELSRLRMAEAVSGQLSVGSGRKSVLAGQTRLLFVGRGSPDESATAEMQEFARLRQHQEGGVPAEVAFLAMARPLLGEMLEQLAAARLSTGFSRVVVQPHLLFAGDLAESLVSQVESVARANPEQEWLVTPLLADALGESGCGTELLIEAILDRCSEAITKGP